MGNKPRRRVLSIFLLLSVSGFAKETFRNKVGWMGAL